MPDDPVVTATRTLGAAVAELRAEVEMAAPDVRIGALRACEQTTRQLEQLSIVLIAWLDREGVFADRGCRRPRPPSPPVRSGCATSRRSPTRSARPPPAV